MRNTVKWVVRLEGVDASGRVLETSEIGSITREIENAGAADFGLRLAEGKAILEQLQLGITQRQVDAAAAMNRCCSGCGSRRSIHDYQARTVRTVFGKVVVKLPRLRSCPCKGVEPKLGNVDHLLSARTTPELDNIMAELGARHSFREAARILQLFLPASGATNHTAVRERLGKVADQIEVRNGKMPYRMRTGLSIHRWNLCARGPGLPNAAFRGCMERVEATGLRPSHFAAMPNAESTRNEVISVGLKPQGWLPDREIVVFSDGDPSLADAVRQASRTGVTHILDWFHVSMRIQHLRENCRSLVKVDEADQFEFRFAARELDQMRAKP